MKIFVSYSFQDSELPVLTLLLDSLRNEGHVVETSDMYYRTEADYPFASLLQIRTTDLFIGIITDDSDAVDEVNSEWVMAREEGVRGILLVEHGVQLSENGGRVIRFNRKNPKRAIDQILPKKKKKGDQVQKIEPSDILVIGGVLVALAVLVDILSSKR